MTIPGVFREADAPFREPPKHHGREYRMDEYQSLNHTKWECKYHVVFIPKYRRKALFEQLRRELGPVFRSLTKQRESSVRKGT